MDSKQKNTILWVLIALFSLGILGLGYAISQKKSSPVGLIQPFLPAAAAPKGDELPELRLSAFMSPDVASKTKAKSAPAAAPQNGDGEPPVLVGGGDLKLFSKPKSRRDKPKPRPKPKMKLKRRK
jgi:hypothetical protein